MGLGSSDEPPQRRDNGLRAEQFVALADVDPRLGEHLLDLLKLADIPAYLEPSADPLAVARYPVNGPIERLYVQADQRRAAREVVVAAAHEAGETPIPQYPPPQFTTPVNLPPRPSGPRPDVLAGLDTDAEFARMMANFDAPAPAPVRPVIDPLLGSSTEAGTASTEAAPASAGDTSLDRIGVNRDPARPDPAELDANAEAKAAERAAASAEPDDEEHFERPSAPPFPVPRPATLGAFALFLLGLLVMARGAWLGLGSDVSFPLGVAAVLTAAGLLIRGLRDSPPEDAEPDDGAIV